MDTSHAPESFRGLLLRHRGRTGLTQRDLAARAGASLRSVQDWEAGVTLPRAERLQGLVKALLEAGSLTAGREMSEARELWTAMERETPRLRTPFDAEWFAGLLETPVSPRSAPASDDALRPVGAADRAQDWDEAPDTAAFVGRAEEVALLHSWLLEERCRLVVVLGIGGIGKTSLAAWAAQKVASSFDRVYWRSLRNAPPVHDWLAGAIGFLSDQHTLSPASEPERTLTLLRLLRSRRCLLVLDNSETLFEPGQQEGRYRVGMEGYGRVLQAVGETSHQSCLLLTSREAPPELTLLTGVRWLELHGLGIAEAQALLADKHLIGDPPAWRSLVDRYGGNGLALKIVGERIRQVYGGDVAGFVREAVATYGTVFGGIRRLLDVQAERLSPVERDVLIRLAVEREPITMRELSAAVALAPSVGQSTLIEAVETLRHRSFVELAEGGARFTLQSMVLEYVTDRLVETVADEIARGVPAVLVKQPLIKAQAKDYVRQTQERLIGTPILQRLNAQDAQAGAERPLLALLDAWRGRPAAEQGYGPGNVVNLLRLLRGDLRSMNLSRLALHQVYLQGVEAQDANLAGADLAAAVLNEAFAYPTAVALSADGALLAAATPTGEVRLWRVADRTLLLAAVGHTGMVWSVALSRDGQLVASGGADGLVKLWEALGGRPLATWQGHTGEVRGVAVSPDGRLLASGGVDGLLKLWEAHSGRLLNILKGHTGAVWAPAFSADGQLMASGGDDGTVRLWNPGIERAVAVLQGHDGGVWGVALSGDGRLVASGGVDGLIKLWDAPRRRALATLQGHTGAVWGVALSGDGRLLASGGFDGTVRLWETDSGRPLATLQGHTGAVRGLACSADGRLVASGSWDGTLRLWESPTGQLVATLQGHTSGIRGVAFSDDGRLLASGAGDGTVRLWEPGTGQFLAILQGHAGAVWGLAFSGDGQLLASGSDDGTVRLWEPSSGRPLATLRGHTGAVVGSAFSRDGGLLASSGGDATVRLWDPGSGRPLATLEGHVGMVMAVALSRDARCVASGGVDGTVRLWEPGSGRPLATLRGHTGAVRGVAFSGDGRLLASAGFDATVRLWERDSGRPLATLQGHTGAVWGLALSDEGQLIVSGSLDGSVRVWESASGQLLARLEGHTGAVRSVALSGDGRNVASGGDDGMVRLWDVQSGACLRTLRSDRHYQRLDITGLTGVTDAQRAALLAQGAIEAPI